MSLTLNTGNIQYKENSTWTPLLMSANVNLTSLAEQFSTVNTYAVDDYVLYNGRFYKCTTAVTTAGDWNASNWTETRIGTELEYVNINNIMNAIYPVGSIYMSVNSTSPASLFGGTWEQIKDMFLMSAGDTYAAGASGGSASHSHTTGGHTLTTSEIPAHTHNSKALTGWFKGHGYPAGIFENAGGIAALATKFTNTYHGADNDKNTGANSWQQINITATHTHDSVGSGGSHSHGDTGTTSNIPPYLAVYVWKRVT